MAKRGNISDPVLQVLFDLYSRSIRYQQKQNQITVTMTFDEYLSLWSDHRVRTLTTKLSKGKAALDFYLKNTFRPVLSWKNKKLREKGGDMTVAKAAILNADDSKKLFQFKTGDKHSARSRGKIGAAKLGKEQSNEHVRKRTEGQIGQKRGPMSQAAKDKLRETRATNKAAMTYKMGDGKIDHRKRP